MKQYYKDIEGQRIWYKGVIHKNGRNIYTWNETLILEDGWTEYIPEPVPPHEPTVKELIQQEIRQKYEETDEWMINRRMNNALNPNSEMTDKERALAIQEFNEYNFYVEEILIKYTNE